MMLPTPGSLVADHCRDRGVAARVGEMIGEQVMEALATLAQVAFIRSASVYRNFREAKDFGELWAKSRRMTINASCHNWFPLWRGGWLIPNGNHSLPGFGHSLPSLWRQETYCLRRLWKPACRHGRSERKQAIR